MDKTIDLLKGAMLTQEKLLKCFQTHLNGQCPVKKNGGKLLSSKKTKNKF